MVQHLEPIMRDVLKAIPNSYYMKLQVNPMAHTKTPGDFYLSTENYNYIIECKEQKGTSFPFSRLTQLNILTNFNDALERNRGIVALCFWKGRKKKSTYYLIRIELFKWEMACTLKKSLNEKDLEQYKVEYEDLYKWFI